MNPIRAPSIDKITVHIGTGESGERLSTAEKLLQTIVKQKTVRAKAKKTIPTYSIKKHEPIGCKVTLRGNKAVEFLKTALKINENRLSLSQFDTQGNFSFGIEEHTDFPGMKYDPFFGTSPVFFIEMFLLGTSLVILVWFLKHKIPQGH